MRILILPVLAALLAASAQAQIQIPPPDLQGGQSYRILFVTESARNAMSTDIADYNAFVAADANASPQLAALNTNWRALAATSAVNARTNTDTDPTASNQVPIYLPNGTRIADDYADLWDGQLAAPPNSTSLGNTIVGQRTWTGFAYDGTLTAGHFTARPLGGTQTNPIQGDPSLVIPPWAYHTSVPRAQLAPLYGISDQLVAPHLAKVEDLGPSCTGTSIAFRFVPNGNGGHDVVHAGSDAFDPNIGVLAGATADDQITATNLDLGFPFPFPTATGTVLRQWVRIDPNGRIIPNSTGLSYGGYPDLDTFLDHGYPQVCPFWTDFNVEEPISDGIYWKTQPGSATFTWNNVAQFSSTMNNTRPLTVHCTMFDTGEVLVVLEDIEHFSRDLLNGCLIGISSGDVNGTPPEVDLSEVVGGAMASGTPAYQYWYHGPIDLQYDLPQLVANSRPLLGTDFEYQMSSVQPDADTGLYLIGTDLLPSAVPVATFGYDAPCLLTVSFVDLQVALADGNGNIAPASIAIPATPTALLGFELVLQGVSNGFPFSSPIRMSNTLRATLGDQ